MFAMEENELKFEPIYVSVLTLVEAGLIYMIYGQQSAQKLDLEGLAIVSLIPLFFGLMALPMAFKLLTGVPAIKLTADTLVDNVFGIEIDWSNVQNLYIQGSKKPFLAIDLKDKDKFYAGISNPFKRLFLRLMFAISPGDVSINLAFVAGTNESVLAMSQVYWNRFYGIND
jgi:hypothetical protein